EADPIYLNFPHRHDLHLGYNASGTTNPSLAGADAILVVEADVPWYPALQKPAAGAPIIHLGVDPFFSRYPMRSYPCDVPIAAALPILTVVFNNQQWEAVKFGALAVHPNGVAKTRGRFPLSELTPSPRFEEMAKTVDGYGERVESPGELPAALKRGLAAVREG